MSRIKAIKKPIARSAYIGIAHQPKIMAKSIKMIAVLILSPYTTTK